MDVKKMIAATAAIVGTVAMADGIVSSSVVGYQNLETRIGGLKMIAPTFLKVTSTTGCTLADSGYVAEVYSEDDEDYVGGVGTVNSGSFVLNLLSSTGTSEASYYFIDAPASKGISAGWYADNNGTAIEGGAESVVIEAGRALWITGRGFSLTSAGAVGTADIAYVTRSAGLSACGNATPIDLTLAKLYVSGYDAEIYSEDDEDYVGGIGTVNSGSFVVNFLSSTGTSEASYYYIDAPASKGVSAGWYADNNGTAIEGGAASITVPAGQGLWVSGRGFKLNIPAPELEL